LRWVLTTVNGPRSVGTVPTAAAWYNGQRAAAVEANRPGDRTSTATGCPSTDGARCAAIPTASASACSRPDPPR
jgi:hypothetical protein